MLLSLVAVVPGLITAQGALQVPHARPMTSIFGSLDAPMLTKFTPQVVYGENLKLA